MSPVLAFVLGAIAATTALLIAYWFDRRAKAASTPEDEDNNVSTMSQVLHLAIQGSTTGFLVVNRTGRVILSNPRAHEMSIVHGRTVNPTVMETAAEVFEDLETRTIDLELPKRATGSLVRSVRAVVKPLTLTDTSFVIVYGTDESENVRMESARRDFVANVSHELKTPVGGVSLLAQALLQDPGDPEMVTYFGEKLLKESHRMGDMITDLISLSKLQGAEALPDMAPVRVDDVIDDAIQRNQVTADNREIELTRSPRTGIKVMGDRALLTAAVSNLVSNAINYSPNNQPVTITQKVVRDSVILIRVTDRGIGIEPEDQKRVFERFYRVDKARSRATGGTGLGLAIVKHVVANHGGNIKLWSRPETGSTFTIELPIYTPEAQVTLADRESEQPGAQPAEPQAGLRQAVNRVAMRRKEREKQ
ncbi:sensor histidine kinase [Corynebacterium lipophiloflavum]|uniref:Sensor-like histidine kinase SenX3 n=1 Tax=Corynebacterium lipophiloflavum (strain ATCC 700352 / DSM 44291 / CCUG 37336 / JCM 10383 / DMMZ 1944) TaxID=525263 RepID=C0XUD7_CORLD|nr:ATPase/histidine kinase/DNA gyrase B/HSP90 domain protein [Corynebacterium lipophiloflavum DSM 44291]